MDVDQQPLFHHQQNDLEKSPGTGEDISNPIAPNPHASAIPVPGQPITTTTTTPAATTSPQRNRAKKRSDPTTSALPDTASTTPTHQETTSRRRSTRISIAGPSGQPEQTSNSSIAKGKKRVHIDEAEPNSSKKRRPSIAATAPAITSDRKGKKRAPRSATPPNVIGPSTSTESAPSTRLNRRSSAASTGRYELRSKPDEETPASTVGTEGTGKGKAKEGTKDKGKKVVRRMPPRSATPSKQKRGSTTGRTTERTKKGDSSAKHLIDDPMDDDDESQWMDEPGASNSSRLLGGDDDENENDDENMDGSDNDDDEDEENSGDDEDVEGGGGTSGVGGLAGAGGGVFDRFARLAAESGMQLDEATAAALFGGEFRSFGGMMSGLNNRFKRLKADLKSKNATKRLNALRECSELLLVSNEDTLGGAFSTTSFATEFIAILNGKPNIDEKEGEDSKSHEVDEMDEDAQLAAALAMSTGGEMPAGMASEDDMEAQLLACRCLAHLIEALPGSGHTLVHLGAVPVLCSKLKEIAYIELAEQTLSTMEKISAEYPSAIVREGGLPALLGYLPFFSTNVQRTAVTAAANCCRNISSEHYAQIKEVFPTLRETLMQADQRLVEQATIAVQRTIESYRHNAEHLEGLLDLPTVAAITALLMPSAGSPLISSSTYTHLLKALTSAARGSAKVTIAFLEAGMTNTVYQILTGMLPSSRDEEEDQGASASGQGLAGGVADMVVLQNLAHRPKDQVEEALALISELLPPLPRDGVFDARGYTEKAVARAKKGRKSDRPDRPTRRSSRQADVTTPSGSAGPSTPAIGGSTALPGTENTPVAGPSNSVRDALVKAKKDAEGVSLERVELLRSRPELVGKFVKAIVPVLVDVYAASVAYRVRTKVLVGLVKAVAFAPIDDLRITLKSVPMASFLCAIIASKDNAFFVQSALQLVELLANKLPDVYKTSFLREGVVYEIENLAAQELSTAKTPGTDDASGTVVKTEPEEHSTPTPAAAAPGASAARELASMSEDMKALFPPGMPSGLSAFLAEAASSGSGGIHTPKKPSNTLDPNDANILRARMFGAKKIFDLGGEDNNAATAVMDELASAVAKLCRPEATEAELRDTLRDIATRFSSAGQALSSFELLKSGLVDGLLEFVDIDGTVSTHERRSILFETFAETTNGGPPPLTMLVKRLHESLGRLEDFEVEVAFNGVGDASRNLGKTMRIRLQADEGQDIPKQVSALSVTIQAIAPMQALHDYLRPRVADGTFGSGLAGLFSPYAASGAMAIPRGGSGSTASRLLAALGGTGLGSGMGRSGGGGGGAPIASSAPESSGRLGMPLPPSGVTAPTADEGDKPSKPVRRRSARLSGQPVPETPEPAVPSDIPAPTQPSSAGAVLSSSAPEPSILPPMPMNMDMDFDDDGYTDEEYDAEVFEDEMEEELQRPQEKVVNMSVAPDGLKVEAKTPDGTRVATPSQHPPSSNTGPGPSSASGAATPRTASYAGAVKTSPADWHLEFSLNGERLSLEDTIYGAMHRHQKKGDATPSHGPSAPSGMGGVFGGMPIVFKFRKVDGPAASNKAPLDAPSPASVTSTMPAALGATAATSKILRLLRVVHNLSVEARDATGAEDTHLDENLFINNKLTAKLSRQLEEVMIIASNCLPEWAIELPKHFSFLFPFEARYLFLQSTSFGYGRLITRTSASQASRNSSRRGDDLGHLARIVRQKVRISRSQLLESAAKVLELYGTSSGILEVEYFDEIGTGLGPTLEFYSLASREFARKPLGLWRDEDESKPGNYVHHPRGLFPVPVKEGEPAMTVAGSKLSWYKTLGLFVGRALLDSRIIDVHLNRVFLKLILGRPVKKTIATLKQVDMPLARSLERLQAYLQARKEIEALQLPASSRRSKIAMLSVGGAKLPDLSLDFTLPGYDIELKPGGRMIDVDDSNLEEYLERVLDMTLGKGVEQQAKAFQAGFSMIFPIQDLQIFSPEELGLLFGNAEEDWSRETLEQVIKADHGYNLDSRAVQNLVEVMSSYDKDQRRQFLQFITGAPKLPIGGFRGLTPPFTVVRKPHEAPFKADDYLPSVMTCAQYLKMPDYSTKEILAAQLERAMQDGGGSFHLS